MIVTLKKNIVAKNLYKTEDTRYLNNDKDDIYLITNHVFNAEVQLFGAKNP